VTAPRLDIVVVAVACAGLFACAPASSSPPPRPGDGIALAVVASGLDRPLYATAPAGDRRLFIVEQAGVVRIVRDGKLLPTPYLDLRDRVRSGGERGLLSIAFHPRYATNGFVFVNYTDHEGDTRVVRFTVSADPDRADPATAKFILHVAQPYANHNGGHVLFGPDSMLYIGMGDGGSGGDPQGNGQNRSALLGKLLRIDVDHGDPYAIPRDNPYAHPGPYRPEIWAWGLRNPWRFAFDRVAGLLYIADVGQNQWEEVDVAPARSAGLNYGWNVFEATHCYGNAQCDPSGFTMPIVEYDHGQGCSITGGFVYRGRALPALAGHYFYADYCSGWIRSFKLVNGAVTEHRQWRGLDPGQVMSFGEDGQGELLVCSQNGRVYRIVAAQ
jgi:glucose/arabinose dehydrogenase